MAVGFTHRQRLTLLATSFGLFMIYLDATIVNVALPDIQKDFGGGEQALQWVVAAYSLTMGMFIMSAATLADRVGRRRAFILGTILFMGASTLCGLAPTIGVLNIGRGLQGVGAATVNVASLALVTPPSPTRRKARAIGLWTGIASVGLAIGPTVGGFLTESVGWRSIFFVNVIVGLLAVVLVRAFVEESSDPATRDLDLPRSAPVHRRRRRADLRADRGAPRRLAVADHHRPLRWRRRARRGVRPVRAAGGRPDDGRPRLPRPRLHRGRTHALRGALRVYGQLLVITQYFQNIKSYSPERAGVIMLIQTAPMIVLAPVAGGWPPGSGRGGRPWPVSPARGRAAGPRGRHRRRAADRGCRPPPRRDRSRGCRSRRRRTRRWPPSRLIGPGWRRAS